MRIVVVTGASAGVGRAASEAFAARGDAVALLAREPGRLRTALGEIEAAGGRGMTVTVDVVDAAAVERAASRIEEQLGPIDVWVNNAMVSVFAPFEHVTPDEYRRVTEVTYLGSVWGTLAALRRMRQRDRGVVVQVGSALAYRGIPLQAAYCGAKHALQGFHESLRAELRHDGSAVRLAMVQLPAINTPQFDWVRSRLPRRARPVPPVYAPDVAARAILAAADAPRCDVLVGWPTVRAIVGNAVASGIVDRLLARDGFDAQQTSEPEEPGRPDNLFVPVPLDVGAEGRFGVESRPRALRVSGRLARGAGAAAAAGALVGAAALGRSSRN
jgi:NAD(P)-dependent dehydrogenase (short-subunit alcohol dehydrogenase family)